MQNAKNENKYWLIVFIVVFVFFYAIKYYNTKNESNLIYKKGIITTGQITKVSYGGKNNSLYVDGFYYKFYDQVHPKLKKTNDEIEVQCLIGLEEKIKAYEGIDLEVIYLPNRSNKSRILISKEQYDKLNRSIPESLKKLIIGKPLCE